MVKDGTEQYDYLSSGGVANDESVILAEGTRGEYAADNAGAFDFVVIKLDDDGEALWTWQVRDCFTRASLFACTHVCFQH